MELVQAASGDEGRGLRLIHNTQEGIEGQAGTKARRDLVPDEGTDGPHLLQLGHNRVPQMVWAP
jgi:hypothetical protein